MDYKHVLAGLTSANHTRIMVSGPQRSGTTIATKMLAEDLGFRCVLEEEFNFHDLTKLVKIVTDSNCFVIQAPTMSSICHRLQVAVVFMRRSLEDIGKSQDRIKWDHEHAEKNRYFHDGEEPIAQVKYRAWEKHQRAFLPPGSAFDLDYESLKGHRLWIDKELRVGFRGRQTQNDLLL